LLAIVVLLGAVIGVMTLGFSDSLGDPSSMAVKGQSVQVDVAEDETTQTLQLVHRSGQNIAVEDLEIIVSGDSGTSTRLSVPKTGDVADGTWSTGDRIDLSLDASTVCSGDPDSVDIQLVQQPSEERSYLISSTTVPVKPGQFTISGGGVSPTVDYDADAELLGTALTYGPGGPDIPISVTVGVGSDSYTPWPGNVNDGGNPRSESFAGRTAGESIVITAEGEPYGGYSGHVVNSQADAGTFVHVLRNGSAAPDVSGFADQSNAEEFVDEYVDNGRMVLDDNQAIYLFELSHSTSNTGADFQDAVVLVTLDTSESVTTLQEGESGTDVILCPAEA
jgi:FlaG/FlaF family flagellin (archaellin)